MDFKQAKSAPYRNKKARHKTHQVKYHEAAQC